MAHKSCSDCGSCKASETPFRMDVPLVLIKGEDGKKRIGGIVSTEHKDQQGEVVKQDGLDFSPCLRGGWFNDNHSRDTAGVLGVPERIKRITYRGKPATYVEGELLEGYRPAEKIWDLAQSLQGSGRQLGFSIEGKVLRREGDDGKTIAQALVRNIAITNCPVNDNTVLEVLAKSMCENGSSTAIEIFQKSLDTLKDVPLEDMRRALMAGAAVSAPATATPGDGFALRPESLEGGRHDVAGRTKKKRKRRLSKSEAAEFIRGRYPGLASAVVDRIINLAQGE